MGNNHLLTKEDNELICNLESALDRNYQLGYKEAIIHASKLLRSIKQPDLADLLIDTLTRK